jgi:hypothetical protein
MSGYPTQKTWRDYLRIRVRSLMLLISLRGTEVTDAGLRHLRNLVGLESLDLNGTAVTSSGVSGLRRALPNAEIILR